MEPTISKYEYRISEKSLRALLNLEHPLEEIDTIAVENNPDGKQIIINTSIGGKRKMVAADVGYKPR